MSAPQLTVFVQGQGAVNADQYNTFVQGCDTFAELRAFVGIPGMQVYARGQTVPNDSFQGNFYWDVSATGPDDNDNVIIPPGAASGGWVRLD